jgi:hypothetical protein
MRTSLAMLEKYVAHQHPRTPAAHGIAGHTITAYRFDPCTP